ncbi:8628_t:CDS:2, partial [Acaulospora morrowiae]
DIKQIDETVKNIEGGNEKNKEDNNSTDFEKLVGVSKGNINNIYTNGKRDSAEVISDIFDTPYENSFAISRGATPPITPHRNSLSSSINSFPNNRNNTSVQPLNGISSLSQPIVSDGQLFNRGSASSINFNSQSTSGIPSLPPPMSINQFTGTSISVRPSTNPQDLLNSIPSPTSSNRPHSFGQTNNFGLMNSTTASQPSTTMRTLNNLYTSTPTLNSIALQPKTT